MNRQLQTTMDPNDHPFPSTSQMLRPQHQSFYNTQTFLPQPSPPINPPPFKRRRTLQTPTDHKTLCHLKKVERQTIKSMHPCATHQTGMIEIPYQILRCVQAQGLKLSRTNETVEYLSEQVTSLHEMVKTAVAALRSFKQSSKDTAQKTPHPLLPTYLSLVTQTIETLKSNPPSPNALKSTSESLSNLHQLILLQCDFDSLGGPPKESKKEPSNGSSLQGLTSPTTPSLESMRKTLKKMEQNLKTFIDLQGTTKMEDSLAVAITSRNKDESSRAVRPPFQLQLPPSRSSFTTSTPVRTNRHIRNPSRLKRSSPKKRTQRDDDVDNLGIGASFGNLSVIPHTTNTRKMLHPTKSFSFSYMPNSMDVD